MYLDYVFAIECDLLLEYVLSRHDNILDVLTDNLYDFLSASYL
jgi:hypothetical protein